MLQINCDMGESFGAWKMGSDSEIMPHIDMANIACGFHASDPLTMKKTVKLAVEFGVKIGAHPSYPDLVGFGRRDMQISPDELTALTLYQIGALDGICRSEGTRVEYVKPHGALYNRMIADDAVLHAVLRAVAQFDKALPVVVMAIPDHHRLTSAAASEGLKLWFEVFSDRAYDEQGRLASRSLPGAVLTTDKEIERQVRAIVERSSVITLSGKEVPVIADTICVHGDGARAVEGARFIRSLVT